MSPPPEEFPQPLLPAKRPASLTFIGIIGIIFGAAGIICVGGLTTFSLIKGDPTMEQAPQAMMMLNIALVVIGVLLSLFWLIGSIGLLSLRAWSRTMMIIIAWVDLIFDT